MRALTIRTRITGGSMAIAILISVVAGILIYSQVHRIVTDGQSAVLDNVEAPYLVALAKTPPDDVDAPGPGQLVSVIDPRGAVRVNSLPSVLAPLDVAAAGAQVEGLGSSSRIVAGGAGVSYLVRVTQVASASGTWKVISAVDNEVQSTVLGEVVLLLIVSIASINIAFGAASWFIGAAALSPVARLRRSAAQLARRPGTELLPVGPAEDEIAELARTLNALITQLRASLDRERLIVSDASHELRTPLAILQTQLELAQAEASSLAQMQGDVAAAQQTLARLSGMATSMLELSRIELSSADFSRTDSHALPAWASVAELATELGDAADRGRARVGGRNIRIEYSALTITQATVATTVPDFGRVCDNLVSNALSAMGRTGVIFLTLEVDDREVRLAAKDDAGGMDAAFVPHAFDRFSRNSSGGTGAGLGLAIVQAIAVVAGGRVALDNRPGDGVTVTVCLPLVRSPGLHLPDGSQR